MMEKLSAGWRGRRALLIGGENGLCGAMKSMMAQIGVRETCVGMDADAQTLCRALGKGRTSAVFLLEEPKKGSLPERTAALLTMMTETREAGVPLFMLLSDLRSSPIQTVALGVSRGLLGDPVRTIILRHKTDCRVQDVVCGALLLGVRAFEKPELNGTFRLYEAQTIQGEEKPYGG